VFAVADRWLALADDGDAGRIASAVRRRYVTRLWTTRGTPMTSRELLIVGGGLLLMLLLVPMGGTYQLPGIFLITILVVVDLARERRKREPREP
jgi:hypothetical protein